MTRSRLRKLKRLAGRRTAIASVPLAAALFAATPAAFAQDAAAGVLENIIVTVKCPACDFPQPSPDYPGSFGWCGSEVSKRAREVECFRCGALFKMPAVILALLPGAGEGARV